MMTPENKTSSDSQSRYGTVALISATVLVLLLIGFVAYSSHSRRVAEADAAEGPAKTTVLNERQRTTPEVVELRQSAVESAEKWREEVLAKPPEERTLSDGTVLVPEVTIFEDNDVYIPMRRMVPAEREPEVDNAGMPIREEDKPKPPPVE